MTPGLQATQLLFALLFLCANASRSARSTPPVLPAADHGSTGPHKSEHAEHPPRLEVCGGPGMMTSGTVGSGLTPLCSGAAPVRQPGGAHLKSQSEGSQDARGQDHSRLFSGRVHSSPSGQGVPHPTLYHTDPFTASNLETAAGDTMHNARRTPLYQGVSGVPLAGKGLLHAETGWK